MEMLIDIIFIMIMILCFVIGVSSLIYLYIEEKRLKKKYKELVNKIRKRNK